MSNTPSPRDPLSTAAVIVGRPRAGDAIGEALRGAFAGDYGLPADMMAYLRVLDKSDCCRPA